MVNNRVLLMNAPQLYKKESRTDMRFPIGIRKREVHSNLKFPLGLLYIAGELEKHGFEVKILDCPVHYKKKRKVSEDSVRIGLYPEDIEKEIKEFKPNIVGITCAYTFYESDSFEAIQFVRDIEKKLNQDFLIVIGGAHTSANPEYVLRNKNIDMAVIGEGEETIAELAIAYRDNKPINNIHGTALVEDGEVKINPHREYIQDLDATTPAWHLLDMNMYFNHPDNSSVTLRGPSVDIITSRGCPAACTFCSIHTVWGRKWRAESPKSVVDMIEHLMKTYGVKQFRIQDDNMTMDNQRAIDICDEIINRGLDISWDTPNGVAFWALTNEVILKMRQAGCYRITFGIESGSKNSQKYVKKVVNMDRMAKTIEYCHKVGMWVCSTFIIGFPYETHEDVADAVEYILNSGVNFPFIYVAQPYLGTAMYEDFKKEGLLVNIKGGSNIAKTEYNTKYFTNDELNSIIKSTYKKFYKKKMLSYFKPKLFYKEFLSKLRNYEDMKYLAKNVKFLALSPSV